MFNFNFKVIKQDIKSDYVYTGVVLYDESNTVIGGITFFAGDSLTIVHSNIKICNTSKFDCCDIYHHNDTRISAKAEDTLFQYQ